MEISGALAQDYPAGCLYVTAVPIGNMADMTLRALAVLNLCDAVAAEDTRMTKKLLEKFSIRKPLMSVREHNEASQEDMIIQRLLKGERIALVTDAGTPAISDPGAKTVEAVRKAGLRVVPVPGACACVTALSAAGLSGTGFTFAGFLPPQAGLRDKALAELAGRGEAFVLYEAPHRLNALLASMAAVLEPEREITVARELTKRFECIETLPASALAAYAASREPRGEYALVIHEKPKSAAPELSESDRKWLFEAAKALPPSKAAALAAKVTGIRREDLYTLLESKKNS